MVIVFRIYYVYQEPLLQQQCIIYNQSNKVFQGVSRWNKLFQYNIVTCLENEYIHQKTQWKIVHDNYYWATYTNTKQHAYFKRYISQVHTTCDKIYGYA